MYFNIAYCKIKNIEGEKSDRKYFLKILLNQSIIDIKTCISCLYITAI